MNIYEISQPGKQIVDVQGVAIRTVNVSVTVPPSLPNFFQMYARVAPVSSPPNQVILNAQGTSYTIPFIQTLTSGSWCYYYLWGTNAQGQTYRIGGDVFRNYYCGSAYVTPGNTTVNRCDIIVTIQSSPLQELRLEGLNSQPCGTWTTRTPDDCRDTEIKCPDPSDPRGFCCIPCDTLNTKLRTIIL